MARLGFRKINEMVGHAELLKVDDSLRNFKTANLDLTPILTPATELRSGVATHNVAKQNHKLYVRLDNYLIDESEAVLSGTSKSANMDIQVVNTDRALGTTLSYHVSKKCGEKGLPEDSIHVRLTGSAGQSLGAFLAPGVFFELEGDSNDYVGKGLSGGKLAVYPPKCSSFKSEENVIVGNVCLYGATSGKAYFRGMAAERFCVRNSGAIAVCEGVGDHGCEYMTDGRVVILGSTGRNFASGMSGGIAYVLDLDNTFKNNVNMEMVQLETVTDIERIVELRNLIEDHRLYTGSEIADRILKKFNEYLPKFAMVMPTAYGQLLKKQREDAKNPVKEVKPCQKVVHKKIEPAVDDVEDSILTEEEILARREKLDKLSGFIKYKRKSDPFRSSKKPVGDWNEVNNAQLMSST
jgi:glutamate synthase (NADPH/NADH)